VSKRTIYDWTHTEYVPHYKFPNGVRFSLEDINRWLNRKHRKGRLDYLVSSE